VLVDEQGGILAGWAGLLQADAYGRFDESKTAGSAPATTAPIGRCAELRSAPGRGSSPAPTAAATVPPRCSPLIEPAKLRR
jgi:hypothetical protein